MDLNILGTNVGLQLEKDSLQQLANWALVGTPAPCPDFIKQMTIIQYAKVFDCQSFIETGTYTGGTLRLLAATGIQCKSVELLDSLYEAAIKNFASFANVELFHGDSGQMLGTMVKKADAPHIFWLDGHYSDHTTARGSVDTPIVQELEQLQNYDIKNSVILIDDIRDFGKGDYPTVDYLEHFVKMRMPDHVFENFGDIFRITPKVTLMQRMHQNHLARAAS